MMQKQHVPFLLLAFVIFIFLGCSKKDESGLITLNLEHVVGSEDLVFDEMRYTAPFGNTYSVITMRYYVSEIQLVSASGATVDFVHIIYRDARLPETNHVLLGEVPNGRYTALKFVYGLDEDTNITGGLPNTVENYNMEWPVPMGGGYHYMKFEGRYSSMVSSDVYNFNLHSGAFDGHQNYIRHDIPVDLQVDGDDWEIDLVMDIREWLHNPIVYDFEFWGPAIMGNQDAQEVLKANGANVFSIRGVDKI